MLLKNSNYDSTIINQLLVNGITNFTIIDIFTDTPKDSFLPESLRGVSNCDCLIYFRKDRFVLNNSILLFLLQISKLQKDNNILVIGADLGFSLAILSKLVNKVTCIEEDTSILEETKINLVKANIHNVNIIHEKFINILNHQIKFDIILVNGAFFSLPSNWSLQIAENKSIVGVHRKNNLSQVVKITKTNNDLIWSYYKHSNTPYLKGLEQEYKFTL